MNIELSDETLELAAQYKKIRNRKPTTLEGYDKKRDDEELVRAAMLEPFRQDCITLSTFPWHGAGDQVSVEELERLVEVADTVNKLIGGLSLSFAFERDDDDRHFHINLKDIKKNLRVRKALLATWGRDLPVGKLWNDRWDSEGIYRRVGQDAKIIRAWARREGFTVPPSGKMPYQIVDAYVLAHKDKWSEAQVINHNGSASVEVWCYQCAKTHLHGETRAERGKHVGGPKSPHCHHRSANQYWVSDYTAPYPEPNAAVEQLRADAGL